MKKLFWKNGGGSYPTPQAVAGYVPQMESHEIIYQKMNEESKPIFQPPLNLLCLYQSLYMALARAVSARALKTTGNC